MKKFYSLMIAIFAIAFTSQAQNTWIQKADLAGTARYGAVGFSIGNVGYIGTGFSNNGYLNDFWEYDPSTDSWTQKANVGTTGREMAVGFSIGNEGYIGTGNNSTQGGVRNDFWEYDPSTNVWTQKSNFGGAPRWTACGFSIGTKGYIGTGAETDGSNQKDFWEYDPSTDIWTRKADFGGEARHHATGFSIGEKGYIGTGDTTTDDSGNKKDFWEYDPSTDTWIQEADFGGVARGSATGFSIGEKGYIGVGTSNNNSFKKDFWEYDPSTNTWTEEADFGGVARDVAAGFSIGNLGYIGTGRRQDVTFSNDFWEYSPDNSCLSPANLSVTNVTANTAQLNWNIEGTPELFRVSYHAQNGPTQIKRVAGTVSLVTISSLAPNTAYQWTVTGICGPELASPTAAGERFKTTSNKEVQEVNVLSNELNLYPNPSSGTFNINLQTEETIGRSASIQIMNTVGQTVYLNEGMIDNGVLRKEIQLNDVPSGMYLVKVASIDRVFTSQFNLQR